MTFVSSTPVPVRYTEQHWEASRMCARLALIKIAQRKDVIWYSFLCELIRPIKFHPHDPDLGQLIGEVSEMEQEDGKGMLSVVVVHKKGDNMPGAGFFTLAKEFGRNTKDRTACWITELNRVYDEWSD